LSRPPAASAASWKRCTVCLSVAWKRGVEPGRRLAVRRDEELVGREETRALHANRTAYRLEGGRVEGSAGFEVAHATVDVVEPALVEEHRRPDYRFDTRRNPALIEERDAVLRRHQSGPARGRRAKGR
jgi:hypothetical protein